MGDRDGDGFEDVLLGLTWGPPEVRLVMVSAERGAVLSDVLTRGPMGCKLSSLVDLGDGTPSLLMGDFWADAPSTTSGRVYRVELR